MGRDNASGRQSFYSTFRKYAVENVKKKVESLAGFLAKESIYDRNGGSNT
jgi:hypothetical protein